ncbi:MAG TPA: hypothetical protein VGL94_05385 [Ktedonobacteraceae bacterium]
MRKKRGAALSHGIMRIGGMHAARYNYSILINPNKPIQKIRGEQRE